MVLIPPYPASYSVQELCVASLFVYIIVNGYVIRFHMQVCSHLPCASAVSWPGAPCDPCLICTSVECSNKTARDLEGIFSIYYPVASYNCTLFSIALLGSTPFLISKLAILTLLWEQARHRAVHPL